MLYLSRDKFESGFSIGTFIIKILNRFLVKVLLKLENLNGFKIGCPLWLILKCMSIFKTQIEN